MIPIAENITEAINHFLLNNGLICCCYKNKILNCSTLKEANEFFDKSKLKPKKIRNKVRPINNEF